MTAAQRKKLDTIIGKLEALEAETANAEIRGRLTDAKRELIRASQDALLGKE